jgi:hypothetical protein
MTVTFQALSSNADQLDAARRRSETLHLQGLAVSYRRALRGLPPGPRRSVLQAALRRTQAQLRAYKALSGAPRPTRKNTKPAHAR